MCVCVCGGGGSDWGVLGRIGALSRQLIGLHPLTGEECTKKSNSRRSGSDHTHWTTTDVIWCLRNVRARIYYSRWPIFKLDTQKMISEPQTGIEPATLWWPVRRSNHWGFEGRSSTLTDVILKHLRTNWIFNLIQHCETVSRVTRNDLEHYKDYSSQFL